MLTVVVTCISYVLLINHVFVVCHVRDVLIPVISSVFLAISQNFTDVVIEIQYRTVNI